MFVKNAVLRLYLFTFNSLKLVSIPYRFWETGSLSYSSDTMRYTLYSITSLNEARLHWFLNIANTVEPPLSGHPRGTGKWPLNESWPLIEVCQK